MSQLLLAVYADKDTAEHVLGVLRAREDQLTASLESAAVVRLGSNGRFTVIRTNASGSFWGVFWEALFGLVFRGSDGAPTTAGSDSNVGKLFGTIERAGLDERFRGQVRRALRGRRSALALFAPDSTIEALLDQLYLRPDRFVRARLSPEQEGELLNELGHADHPFGVVRQADE